MLKASRNGNGRKRKKRKIEPAIEGNAIIIKIKHKRRLQEESSRRVVSEGRAVLTNVLNNFHLHRTGKMTTKKAGMQPDDT